MKLNFEINNVKYQIEIEKNKSITIIQACESLGIIIPRFCFYDKLSIAGNCRMCLVEVVESPTTWAKKPVAACAINLLEGMSIFTNTSLIKRAREGVLEFLLANHPLDCPICDQGGECDLQDQSMVFGNDVGRFYENKRAVSDKQIGPFVKMIMTRCIHCTRCVRFGNEIAGISVLGVTGRGNAMEIGNYVKKLYKSELSGSIIDLCPVGALTSKPYSFIARPWELRHNKSIIPLYSSLEEVRVEVRGKEIMRILPSLAQDFYEEWITDTVRFCYDGLKLQRLDFPLLKNCETLKFFNVSWDFGFLIISNFVSSLNVFNFSFSSKNLFRQNILSALLGPFVSLEAIFVLKKIAFFFGSADILFYRNKYMFKHDFLSFSFLDYNLFSKQNFFDAFVFVFFNPRLELPLLNLKIRKLSLANGVFVGIFHSLGNLTYETHFLGSKLSDLNKMLIGKHQVCQYLLKFQNVLFLFGINFLEKFSVFDFLLFFSTLLKFYLRNVSNFFDNYKVIFSKVSFLNYIYCNNFFFNSSVFCNDCVSLNLFLNTDDGRAFDNKFFQRKKFNVFLGTNGNSDAEFVDLILPTTSFLESKNHFVNLGGKVNYTNVVLNSEMNVREEWKILFDYYYYLFFFLCFDKNGEIFFSNKDIYNYEKSFLFRKFRDKNFFEIRTFSDNYSLKILHNSFYLTFNNFLNSDIFYLNKFQNLDNARESIYTFDVLTRSSVILMKAKEFEIFESNFE